jgi:hypothetical protein
MLVPVMFVAITYPVMPRVIAVPGPQLPGKLDDVMIGLPLTTEAVPDPAELASLTCNPMFDSPPKAPPINAPPLATFVILSISNSTEAVPVVTLKAGTEVLARELEEVICADCPLTVVVPPP